MKTNLNKLVKLAVAGLFLIALAVNVKVTSEDPFTLINEEAVAQMSSSSMGIWTLTGCYCNGYLVGYSNDCSPGVNSCSDNDCSHVFCLI